MKILLPLAIVFSFLLGVGQARGEYRTVLIHVTHAKDGKPQVTIRSDLNEQKESISVDQACELIKKMVGSGSSVGVSVVLEKGLGGGDAEKLLKAIFANWRLGLTYLGPDMPKEWPVIPPKAPNTGPSIPVTVGGAVKPTGVKEGDEIPLEINIHNGLKSEIAHSTFRLTPVEWHGETTNITLVDIYRDGVKRQLFLARPKVEVPHRISGMGGHRIPPGKSLTIRTDARKWTIDGGWKPGKYEVTVRVETLSVDDGRCRLSVHSEPFTFEVKVK